MAANKKVKEKAEPTSVWANLSLIDVSDRIEKKKGAGGITLSYLSWAWAWGTLKDSYPTASFEKHWFTHENGSLPFAVDAAGHSYVKVTVTVDDIPVTETYPVLNYANKAVVHPDSFEVNTALQRCLAKAIAYHGLGHYIYAGEDLPPDAAKADDGDEDAGNSGGVVEQVEKSELSKAVKETFPDAVTTDIHQDDEHKCGYDPDTNMFLIDPKEKPSKAVEYLNDALPMIVERIDDIMVLGEFSQNHLTMFRKLAEDTGVKVTSLKFIASINKRRAELEKGTK